MSGILSRTAVVFDITSGNFRAKAGDLGEIIAMLAGGVRPDPESLSRLCASMRSLQGFLIEEADQQAAREALHGALAIIEPSGPILIPLEIVNPCAPEVNCREKFAAWRRGETSA